MELNDISQLSNFDSVWSRVMGESTEKTEEPKRPEDKKMPLCVLNTSKEIRAIRFFPRI